MSIWIDRKYVLLVSPKLERFKQINSDLFNFRCPFCFDSQKSKTKARGYIFKKNQNYIFGCHNCGQGLSLKNFLHHLDNNLASEYTIENLKEKHSGKKQSIEESYTGTKPVFKQGKLNIPSLYSLPKDNIAVQYAESRQIPKKHWVNLYYAEDFKTFVESVSDKQLKDDLLFHKPRLIIPFFNRNKQLVSFQGRALDSLSIRYITIKLLDEPKIFGLDNIDISKPILVTEGPIDSLFLPNCIATADSNLAFAEKVLPKHKLTLIPDYQPRNTEIVRQINGFIDKGFSVCLLPENFPGKDINEAILNGLTDHDLLGIINKNTFCGLRAKVEFLKWKKI